ncbi:MAG TPA: hypothetical protein VFN81_08730 [Sphingomicrobium sp.]|nr:hypothetical protein [Sphingomicrobium sp.]
MNGKAEIEKCVCGHALEYHNHAARCVPRDACACQQFQPVDKSDLPYQAEEHPHLRAWDVIGPDNETVWHAPGKYAEEEARELAAKLNAAYELGRKAVRP